MEDPTSQTPLIENQDQHNTVSPVKKKPNKLGKIGRQLAIITVLATSRVQQADAASTHNDPTNENPTLNSGNDTEKKKTPDKSQLPFPESVARWSKLITTVAMEAEVDPLIIGSIIQQETNGDPDAIGAQGELGLIQVMPYHVDTYCQENNCDKFEDNNGNVDYTIPELTLRVGTDLIKHELIAAQNDVPAALAGYNGGPKAREWKHGLITREEYVQYLTEHGFSDVQANQKANVVEYYVDSVMNNYYKATHQD